MAFIFGALSFIAGWGACNRSWMRWKDSEDRRRFQETIAQIEREQLHG